MAQQTLGNHPIEWMQVVEDYDRIRILIEDIFPDFKDFNNKIQQHGGFYLGNSARDRVWQTPSGRLNLYAHSLPDSILPPAAAKRLGERSLVLQTLRSHDQYNTTVYALNDRYRGIKNERRVVFINPADIERLGFKAGDKVDLSSLWEDQTERSAKGFKLVPYDIPQGNIAAYYPETNPLVPLDSVGQFSDTPTSKSIAVELSAHIESTRIY